MKLETFHVIDRYDIPDEFEDVVLKQMDHFSSGCYVRFRLYNQNSEYDRKYRNDLIPVTDWMKSTYPDADLSNVLIDWSW